MGGWEHSRQTKKSASTERLSGGHLERTWGSVAFVHWECFTHYQRIFLYHWRRQRWQGRCLSRTLLRYYQLTSLPGNASETFHTSFLFGRVLGSKPWIRKSTKEMTIAIPLLSLSLCLAQQRYMPMSRPQDTKGMITNEPKGRVCLLQYRLYETTQFKCSLVIHSINMILTSPVTVSTGAKHQK